jgi:hypothetical protein
LFVSVLHRKLIECKKEFKNPRVGERADHIGV